MFALEFMIHYLYSFSDQILVGENNDEAERRKISRFEQIYKKDGKKEKEKERTRVRDWKAS